MSHVDYLVTKTKPACPGWCRSKDHHDKAHDDSSSWYTHRVRLLDERGEGELGVLELMVLQTFEEQLEPGQTDDPAWIWLDVKDDLTLAEAERVSVLLGRAISMAKGAL